MHLDNCASTDLRQIFPILPLKFPHIARCCHLNRFFNLSAQSRQCLAKNAKFCYNFATFWQKLVPKCFAFYPQQLAIYSVFVLQTVFLLKVNVRKVGQFPQNFVQKMMQKVLAVSFCTPHQPSKTRLTPSCFAFDAEHSAIYTVNWNFSLSRYFIYVLRSAKNTWFYVFLLRERPSHFCRKFEKSPQSFQLASRDRYWRWHTDRYVTAVTPRCRKHKIFAQLWPPISTHSY